MEVAREPFSKCARATKIIPVSTAHGKMLSMTNDATTVAKPMPPNVNPGFERKVRLSRAALFFERVWPRAWALAGLGGLFFLVSLLGLWPALSELGHKLVLGAFVLSALALIVFIARTPSATREEAIRRLEKRSGVPHRPASAYEDTLTAAADSPATGALWAAHKSRLAALLDKLRVGNPSPRADRFDPFALRALLLMGLALLGVAVGDRAADRLWAAFRFGVPVLGVDARLDAWVTPPPYTGRPRSSSPTARVRLAACPRPRLRTASTRCPPTACWWFAPVAPRGSCLR